jgi:hypothetical protein
MRDRDSFQDQIQEAGFKYERVRDIRPFRKGMTAGVVAGSR